MHIYHHNNMCMYFTVILSLNIRNKKKLVLTSSHVPPTCLPLAETPPAPLTRNQKRAAPLLFSHHTRMIKCKLSKHTPFYPVAARLGNSKLAHPFSFFLPS
ncbi:unnamed protein product [Periconia digitata]|uniref:Uncharacterized protein n=1 Tax=Periconia digitata TaxID=1303443 RepID=A0A9W4XSQ3_9PLEO|nr:unnamed protein product [Periconia digitata]